MSKKAPLTAESIVKLLVPAGKAAPAPPVGPALGQKGVKAIDFCKQFNEVSKKYVVGVPLTTKITVKPDRTFTFVAKPPPTVWLLKQAAGITKGSSKVGTESVGTLSLKHIYEIAKIKQSDPELEDVSLESITKSVVGIARGIGIQVVH